MQEELKSYGVDLGGRYTLLARSTYFTADVVLTEQQQRETENVLGFKGQQRFIGETAALQYRSNILNTTKGFQEAKTFHFKGKDIILQPEQQIGAFLRKLVHNINEPIVISYPDFYTQQELVRLWRAVQISRVNVIATIPENMAISAYINYCQNNVLSKHLMIIDFGHTKFTAFLLLNEQVICEVFNRQLGTQSMDQLLAEWIIKKANIEPDRKCYLKIVDSCETVRKRLSANTEISIDIENIVPGVDFVYNLKREQYENITEPVFSQISSLCFDLYSQCHQHKFDLIVTIGGGSRIPYFQQSVASIFEGKQIQSSIHATEAICQGCAVAGNLIQQRKLQRQNVEEHYLNLFEHYPVYIGWVPTHIGLPQQNLREFFIQHGSCTKFKHMLCQDLQPQILTTIAIFYDPSPLNFPSLIRSYSGKLSNVIFYYDDYGVIQMQSGGCILIPQQDQNNGLIEMVEMEISLEKQDLEIEEVHQLKYQYERKIYEIRNDIKTNNYCIPLLEKIGYLLEDAERNLHNENLSVQEVKELIVNLENEAKVILS